MRFWQSIFKLFKPSKTFNFRAVGSKATLREIAIEVRDGKTKFTFVAMDRDFDNHCERLIISPGVFYTYGYSWENDVWNREVVHDLVGRCTASSDDPHLWSEIDTAFLEFEKTLRSLVRADAALQQSGLSAIPRSGEGRILQKQSHKVSRSELAKLLSSARKNGYKHRNDTISVQKDCFGHLFSKFSRELVEFIHKSHLSSRSGMRAATMEFLAISSFSDLITNQTFSTLFGYYLAQFKELSNFDS
ncbi:MAG: DUF4435 domain-containing protein [Candidatus Obscuribacter sp.]|nr:DUF4435 domain-containing protein [Candidatus Obscuribacter sp.]